MVFCSCKDTAKPSANQNRFEMKVKESIKGLFYECF
jgi:hypothetical protein